MLPADYPLADLAATRALAALIAPHLRQGDMLALIGELGMGKTAFARALLYELGVTGDVPSPTFTLLQTYEANGLSISHFDLYRLQAPDELNELGWDDALADGVAVVEWPERAQGRLPGDRVELRFALDADGMRHCTIGKMGNWQNRF